MRRPKAAEYYGLSTTQRRRSRSSCNAPERDERYSRRREDIVARPTHQKRARALSASVQDLGFDGDGTLMRGDPEQTPLLVEVADASTRGRKDMLDVNPVAERARSPYSYRPSSDHKLAPNARFTATPLEKTLPPPRSSAAAPKSSPRTARARFVENSSDESDDCSVANSLETRRKASELRPAPSQDGLQSPPWSPELTTQAARGHSLRREALAKAEPATHRRASPRPSPPPSPPGSPKAPSSAMARSYSEQDSLGDVEGKRALRNQSRRMDDITRNPTHRHPPGPSQIEENAKKYKATSPTQAPSQREQQKRNGTLSERFAEDADRHVSKVKRDAGHAVETVNSRDKKRDPEPPFRAKRENIPRDGDEPTPVNARANTWDVGSQLHPAQGLRIDVRASSPRRDYRPRSASHVERDTEQMIPKEALGADLLSDHQRSRSSTDHERRRSRSRTMDDMDRRAIVPKLAFSDDKRALAPPPCPRPESVAGLDDWFMLERAPDFSLCPECRYNIFGQGYETTLQRRKGTKKAKKIKCAMNDPWNRLACVLAFKQEKRPIKQLLAMPSLTDDIAPCPESRPAEGRDWYHLRDTETGHNFQDFQICAHCVESIDIIFPRLQSIFHASKEIRNEARVCSLRSDSTRFGKYLNFLVEMNAEAESRRNDDDINTSDLIWEIKWLTVISPCQRAAKYSGSDWHIHRRLPQLTICEECYYRVVRPVLRASSSSTRKGCIAHEISPQAKEIVGPTSCKLYSSRMRQVFEDACHDEDWEALQSAVIKRSELGEDIERLRAELERKPGDQDLRTAIEHYEAKWKRLERRHD